MLLGFGAEKTCCTAQQGSVDALFYQKLGEEARTNMFGRTPYYPMNQMTKMGVRTDRFCRSDVPGLLVARLAQAGRRRASMRPACARCAPTSSGR